MAKMSRWGGSRIDSAGTLFSRYCFAQASAGVDQGFQQQPGAQGRRWVHWLVPDVRSPRSYDSVRFKRVIRRGVMAGCAGCWRTGRGNEGVGLASSLTGGRSSIQLHYRGGGDRAVKASGVMNAQGRWFPRRTERPAGPNEDLICGYMEANFSSL
jgi:hypothetical protein